MKRVVIPFCALFFAVAGHTQASAQDAYIGAMALVDAVRTSGVRAVEPTSGEAIGGAFRAGSVLGRTWGVELEIARSGDIRRSSPVRILAEDVILPRVAPGVLIFPPPSITTDAQLTVLTTAVFWRQTISDRFQLRYIGGAAFRRTRTRTEITYPLPRFPQVDAPGTLGQTIRQDGVDYGVGVAVGFEAGIRMTEQLRFVPGARLLTAESSWIVRPAVGLEWTF